MSAAIRARLCTAAGLALAVALAGPALLSSPDAPRAHAHRSVTTQAAASADDNGWW